MPPYCNGDIDLTWKGADLFDFVDFLLTPWGEPAPTSVEKILGAGFTRNLVITD